MVRIEFVDASGARTEDYVQGTPCVWIDAIIGAPFDRLQPDGDLGRYVRKIRALIDTGANHSVFDNSILRSSQPVREIPGVNAGVRLYGWVHDVAIAIPEVLAVTRLEVGSADLVKNGLPVPVLLGRDILSRVVLIYDTPSRVFCLKRPDGSGM